MKGQSIFGECSRKGTYCYHRHTQHEHLIKWHFRLPCNLERAYLQIANIEIVLELEEIFWIM